MGLDKTPELADIEERCRTLWEESGIYEFDPDAPAESIYSIDTPPPYVSASHLHVGHAMSYAQAEFIIRYQRMRGRHVFYPMGFDDNGLPTERFVEQKYNIDKSRTTRSEFRELCLKETAEIAAGYERFWRKLGLSVDWSLRYSTIDDHCRRTSQLSFLDLYAKGRIYRSEEPVFWDTAMQTSLAQADLETITRGSTLHDIAFAAPDGRDLIISTTRPELIPSCVALYFHPEDDRYRSSQNGRAITPVTRHEVQILSDEDVKPDFGTGLMMVCTFGDAMDVQRWKRDGLELRMGLDPAGRMTAVAGPYEGLSTEEARKRILVDLDAAGALRGSQKIEQQVSVGERSQRPIEFQMRPHWFIRVLDMEPELLARSAELTWYPDYMKVRLDHWIEGLKYDWNITRQRFYGVPFPIWYCTGCATPIVATEAQLPVDPLEDAPPVDTCPDCGGTEFTGDPDVMDTWMTSSLTPQINANWAQTPGRTGVNGLPMTLRVQAFEIIRTWLFYSVVKAHVHNDAVPWTDVMISGWGLNEQGKKFSKRDLEAKKPGQYSKYDPEDVIDKHGADALRYWAAGSHLGHDLRYHEEDVKAGRKLVLKLWNVTRLAEQYGEGYDLASAAPVATRTPEDRWIINRLEQVLPVVERGFETYDYAIAREALDRFFWDDFCDDYLEIVKDRFWSEERYTDEQRDSARATMWETLRAVLGLYAPFVPFITEELYQYRFRAHEGAPSIHVTAYPQPPVSPTAEVPEIETLREVLRAVRSERTRLRIPQGRPLTEMVIDTSGAAPELRAAIEGLTDSIAAAARARVVRFDSAEAASTIDGVRIDIVPEEKREAS
ncbi:MAG TPA: valine--tRNA ligase [Acidimicrobiia bacterium]|nr:valine--tRNA ligase [Acidimicrobiia bacterium]